MPQSSQRATAIPNLTYEQVPIGWLKPAKRNARKHSAAQIDEIAASIAASGAINPIVVDGTYNIAAGEGRYRALKKLKATTAPVLVAHHLTEAELRRYALSDNRLAEKSSWDMPALALELKELQLDAEKLDLSVTGFDHAKIDMLVTGLDQTSWSDLDKSLPDTAPEFVVTQPGDMWEFDGGHRLMQGDSTDRETVWRVFGNEAAQIVVTDPPYNRPSQSFSGKGQHKHADFAMGAGELTRDGFVSFLRDHMRTATAHLKDGCLLYVCMDWQHLHELLDAGRQLGLELKNILVWDKGKSGMGSLYRSGHELVVVFKFGNTPHINNIALGKHGRDRSNVLRYAGMNRFGGGRDRALAMHPTVKPVQLVADFLLDTSHRGDIVYDGFGGSGTTLIAAHKMERRARLIELSPAYCDTIIERFRRAFASEPTLAPTGESFSEVRAARLGRQAPEAVHGE